MHTATSYQISVSSRHPHVAARIRAIVATSEHNEDSLAEHEYELYECGDEVLLISVNRHDQFQTTMEYEADNTPSALSSASVSASPNTSPSAVHIATFYKHSRAFLTPVCEYWKRKSFDQITIAITHPNKLPSCDSQSCPVVI